MADAVAAVLARHVVAPQALTAALSGGIDSVVLLDLLRRLQPHLGFRLAALHVNHQLSLNARYWADFCLRLCTGWNIPLRIERVSVSRDTGRGVEAAARAVRYSVLATAGTDWVATAHQQDDQIETVFLQLLRGCGPKGIAGMPEVRELEGPAGAVRPRLLRPLLGMDRASIEVYARSRGLEWIDDESNRDKRFARNFLREEILARLAGRFTGYRAAVTRSAEWSREAAQLLDALAEIDQAAATDAQGHISVQTLARLDEARAKNLLRYWLRRQGVATPDSASLSEMLRQLTCADADARVAVAMGPRVIRRFRGHAMVVPRMTVAEDIAWQGEEDVAWGEGRIRFRRACGEGFCASVLERGAGGIRRRRGGERMRLDPARPRRSLKNLLQEAGVPPWDRQTMPLLWCGADLVWVPGVGIAAEYRCGPDEEGWVPRWERN